MSVQEQITYAVSTSVLFDMSAAQAVLEKDGLPAYEKFMIDTADQPLPFHPDFKDMMGFITSNPIANLVITSKNSPMTGARAIRTLTDAGVSLNTMFFTSGASPVPFLRSYGVDHLLTASTEDALELHEINKQGERTAHILATLHDRSITPDRVLEGLTFSFDEAAQHHVVFDLDGVVFSSVGEKYYKAHGLAPYIASEAERRDVPIEMGPAFALLKKYSDINAVTPDGQEKPFKLSVVTARNSHAATRAINTLKTMGIDFNGTVHFRGNMDKHGVLKVIKAQADANNERVMMIDDQIKNLEQARQAGIFAGQTPGMFMRDYS